MKYLKQNDVGILSIIQEIGCYFRAACHMAEMQAGKALSEKQINKIWELSKELKYINESNNVVTSAPIANIAASLIGLTGKFREVATFQNGKMMWYAGQKKQANYYIQKIKQGGPHGTHFRNVDKSGNLLWDPHNPEINMLDIYYTVCYLYEE